MKQLESSISQIIAAGAVGVNLEDALPGHAALRPAVSRGRAGGAHSGRAPRRRELKVHLVINARVDAYWQAGVQPEEAMRGTLERGKAYLQAGADCIFVPGLRNPEHIRAVVDHLRGVHQEAPHPDAPVNILAGPGVPSIPELAKLGVKRVSYGSGPHRAAMGLLRRMADEARTSGTYTALTEGAVPYEEINGLFGGLMGK